MSTVPVPAHQNHHHHAGYTGSYRQPTIPSSALPAYLTVQEDSEPTPVAETPAETAGAQAQDSEPTPVAETPAETAPQDSEPTPVAETAGAQAQDSEPTPVAETPAETAPQDSEPTPVAETPAETGVKSKKRAPRNQKGKKKSTNSTPEITIG